MYADFEVFPIYWPVHCLILVIHHDCLRLDSGMIIFSLRMLGAENILLMVQKSCVHQLRLVVEIPFFARFQKHPSNPGRIEKTTRRCTGFKPFKLILVWKNGDNKLDDCQILWSPILASQTNTLLPYSLTLTWDESLHLKTTTSLRGAVRSNTALTCHMVKQLEDRG